jgi:hypothetical protein
MALDLAVVAPRAVVDGTERGCVVGVLDGRSVAVEAYGTELDAARTVRLDGDVVLLPGLVDTHVHVNEPGRTDWEGFAHATRAAAAGGVTTIVDMPLNSVPPTVDPAALETKRLAAQGSAFVDVGFWGGAVPDNRHGLLALWEAGVFGFKCFLLDSGVPEFPPLSPAELVDYLTAIREFDGLMIVHAEDAGAIEHSPAAHGSGYDAFLRSRPRGAENTARSASRPTTRPPLRSRPARAAGVADIHRVTSASAKPRCFASVQTAGMATWSPAIPPQATPKSPVSSCLSSGVHGEWSETMQSMTPSARPCQSRSRFSGSRIGGQHLNWVAPAGIWSASKTR